MNAAPLDPDELLAPLRRVVEETSPQLRIRQLGRVRSVGSGVCEVDGLPEVKSQETLSFSRGQAGLAYTLDRDRTGVILLDDYHGVRAGDEVTGTGRILETLVGSGLLGRIVDPLGRPLDDGPPLEAEACLPVECAAPGILARSAVSTPLQTGIKVVDALVPVGRGQRELILGDRQTGKTTLALDTILNQRDTGVLCIYCAIGQRSSAVARAVDTLRENGALAYTVVVVASADSAPGLQYVAPYAATAMGEWFMRSGRDVLVVYDDLTCHARAYRELSLLLRRPPGREAFPGDVFYLHSRLLERATHLATGGSLTALPILETEAQNLAAYLPTNLISITDGQIVLSPTLFQKGLLPAVDIGRSVSRVGGDAQRPGYRSVIADLRLAYAQFEELESFSRFDTQLSPETRQILTRGRRVREALKQDQAQPLRVDEQLAVLLAASSGLLDPLPLGRVAEAENAIRAKLRERTDLAHRLEGPDRLDEATRTALRELVQQAIAGLPRG